MANTTNSAGQDLVGFSEQDYAVSAGETVLEVPVNLPGTHTESITMDVIPLTFSQYDTLLPDLPCGPVSSLAGNDHDANSKSPQN